MDEPNPTPSPPSPSPPPKAPMTMAEILAGISDLARNGEGAQRAQAYRMLLGANSGTQGKAEKLDGVEIKARMVRLMRLMGPSMTQNCYHTAFRSRKMVAQAAPLVRVEDLNLPPDYKFPRTVTELYKLFPEHKRPGVPRGYPIGKGVLIQRDWLKEITLKTLRANRQRELDEAAELARRQDAAMREGTDVGRDDRVPPTATDPQ